MNTPTAKEIAAYLAKKDPIIAAPIDDIVGRKCANYASSIHVVHTRMVLNRRLGCIYRRWLHYANE